MVLLWGKSSYAWTSLCLPLLPLALPWCRPWAGKTPGRARLDGYHSESDEELWEYVEVEPVAICMMGRWGRERCRICMTNS